MLEERLDVRLRLLVERFFSNEGRRAAAVDAIAFLPETDGMEGGVMSGEGWVVVV